MYRTESGNTNRALYSALAREALQELSRRREIVQMMRRVNQNKPAQLLEFDRPKHHRIHSLAPQFRKLPRRVDESVDCFRPNIARRSHRLRRRQFRFGPAIREHALEKSLHLLLLRRRL